MIDQDKRKAKQQAKDRIRRRMRAEIDPDNYEYIPAKRPADFYDTEVQQRVAVYVRVSTDDIRQTTSYELQQKYYEDYVADHANWTLVGIYADEGISGTSLKHRDAFNRMIDDCKAGKIDLIITKSVSRFARNVMITIGTARELAHLQPPVGIFFESEAIFSLNDDSQMALTFQATMAEEESHTRSRSMETSLRMRLDNGIPLTPKLLGYSHDADGNLIINPEEAPTVKLAFYMYLYGFSTQQIAEAFNLLERKTYYGNVNWTSGGIYQILRNERHCGDVLTRKTYTEDYRTHRVLKNRGNKPQSRYINHHEAIITRDDYIAVQRMLDNGKYRNKSILPELRVIESGLFKGFVCVNPRWSGFKAADYYLASQSVYDSEDEYYKSSNTNNTIEVSAGDFDLRGFQVAREELFDIKNKPFLLACLNTLKFSIACAKKFDRNNMIELLIHPFQRRIAIRPTDKHNRNGIVFSKMSELVYTPKSLSTAAYSDTFFELMGWKKTYRYRVFGELIEKEGEIAYLFNGADAVAYLSSRSFSSPILNDDAFQPVVKRGDLIQAIPEHWTANFGKPYYQHEQTIKALSAQTETDWKLRIQGTLFSTGNSLKVTGYDDLRRYIVQELSGTGFLEGKDNADK